MNFLLGAMIIDCIANSKEDTSENGAGILFTIGLLIYLIVKLPVIEQYVLKVAEKDINLLGIIVLAFFILLPVYWLYADESKSVLIRLMLRLMLYLDIFSGIGLMVYISSILGSYPASILFDITTVSVYGQSSNFFISLFASIAYLIIKLLDLLSVVALIPILQLIIAIIFIKTKNKIVMKSNVIDKSCRTR